MSFSEDIKKDLELEEIDVEETDCECEEFEPTAQDILDELSVAEEIKRIDNFDKHFEVSEETKNSEFYKETRLKVETMIYMVKVMVNNGVDYNNALSIGNNLIVAKDNLELAKVQEAIQKQQQI